MRAHIESGQAVTDCCDMPRPPVLVRYLRALGKQKMEKTLRHRLLHGSEGPQDVGHDAGLTQEDFVAVLNQLGRLITEGLDAFSSGRCGTGGAENDTATGKVSELTVHEETLLALANIGKILDATNSSFGRIVSAQMLLTDKSDYHEANRAYVEFFKRLGLPDLPARSTALWGVPTSAKVAFSVVAAVE